MSPRCFHFSKLTSFSFLVLLSPQQRKRFLVRFLFFYLALTKPFCDWFYARLGAAARFKDTLFDLYILDVLE